MVLYMTRPTKRSGSSNKQFRKRVPADVQRVARGETIVFALPKALTGDECIEVLARIGTHVEFSLRTADPALAKLRLNRASEHFERTIAAYREGPRRLTQKECVTIAGILYRDLAQNFEDTVKTKSTWHVPLHPHLIEQGFVDSVQGAEDGHLFLTPRPDLYRPEAKASRTKDPRGILGPLQSVKNKLAAFAREVMPNRGDGPSPNHGWRHRFKAVARECGIDLEVRNAFADHASVGIAGDYGKDELYAAMVAALDKIPRYHVE